MTSTFKVFFNDQITTVRDMLHEAVPVTGTIVSGTYNDLNIKNYAGTGMLQSVYDYPFLSSSANHIFDLTMGYSSDSSLSGASSTQNQKKINMYNQMAQVLVGYDATGSIKKFDQDGNLANGTKLSEVFFINLARLLTKDEVKKQSFTLTMLTGGFCPAPSDQMVIQDHGAATSYKINSPAGEYGILYTASVDPGVPGNLGVGLLYYQAGIVVLTASVFDQVGPDYFGPTPNNGNTYENINMALTGSEISGACDGFRNRLANLAFNNTTEINSTIYQCLANTNEFNYSANPTYLTESKIRVKENTYDNPLSYVTSVGLYSVDNELLAVAKLSEPIKKTPADNLTFRVRLDY